MGVESEENPSAFKHSIGLDLLKRIGLEIKAVYPAFDRKAFESINKDLTKLELKPRVQRVRDELRELLPEPYPKALSILLAATKPGKLTGFDLWPFTDFVQTFGLDDRKRSLNALKQLTRLFTSEFAVRPFIRAAPEETLAYLLDCTLSKNEHDRRWASEGSRPRLPWGERLQELVRDPSLTLPILESLRFDPALYVRKSVANHLNDIAKDHPEFVVRTLTRWRQGAKTGEAAERLQWLTKHALRSLIKAGHPGALAAIGVKAGGEVKLLGFSIAKSSYALGESLSFALELKSTAKTRQKLVIDYAIHFLKANGKTSPKVFKWKTCEISPGETLRIEKRHVLKDVTTRVHYSGEHALAIQVNGAVVKTLSWSLEA